MPRLPPVPPERSATEIKLLHDLIGITLDDSVRGALKGLSNMTAANREYTISALAPTGDLRTRSGMEAADEYGDWDSDGEDVDWDSDGETPRRSAKEIQQLHDLIDFEFANSIRDTLKGLSSMTAANLKYTIRALAPPGYLTAWSEMHAPDEMWVSGSDSESDLSDSSDLSDEETEAPAIRRKFEVCRQCNKKYNVLLNGPRSCIWHKGELVEHDEFWKGHDETKDGPVDTDENRRDKPEGFRWLCCNREGDEGGCNTTRHHRKKRVMR